MDHILKKTLSTSCFQLSFYLMLFLSFNICFGQVSQPPLEILLKYQADKLNSTPGDLATIDYCKSLLEDKSRNVQYMLNHIPKVDKDTAVTLYNNGIEISITAKSGIVFNWVPNGQIEKTVVDRTGMMPRNKQVTLVLSKGFWISRTEITLGQYLDYLNNTKNFNPKVTNISEIEPETRPLILDNYNCYQLSEDYTFNDLDKPVVMVNYDDILKFCKWLSDFDGIRYSLPTELQWEIASRGASEFDKWFFGTEQTMLQDFAWYNNRYMLSSQKVGSKKPNLYGLYDMYGNAWEWCKDWYKAEPWPPISIIQDPAGPEVGGSRVIKGGSWQSGPEQCTSDYRSNASPILRDKTIGFRIVISE